MRLLIDVYTSSGHHLDAKHCYLFQALSASLNLNVKTFLYSRSRAKQPQGLSGPPGIEPHGRVAAKRRTVNTELRHSVLFT